ncbi:hypothetical protein L228DRAFT_3496 [Xylona heveae TC161]|uniref:Uncharacterized protein n=1 Tax=Xylona heveae (strain CBS 132557 / TC161) TaxID=1328760 RepID=A0A165JC13_XYLHT|nr:hypothetical protein L228DRAFT_3496 [Xylona heveae TC161]KZF26033.1 hypothetical protein L228DRAFT_3496 [Xylona heveae TC161]
MSLARAFTKRVKRTTEEVHLPMRSATTRRPGSAGNQQTLRHKISLPVQLISTTNMLSFNAPDIASGSPTTPSGSSSSAASVNDEDSYSDNSSRPGYTTPISSPEPSSHDASPVGPEPNHLSCYFASPTSSPKKAKSIHRSKISTSSDLDGIPAIPRRAMSHTKATHTAIARHRSISQHRSHSSLDQAAARDSLDMFSTASYDNNPFSRELEQVNEVAEEFGVRDSVVDEDARIFQQKGLCKYAAEEYMFEIGGLYGGVFDDKAMAPAWI